MKVIIPKTSGFCPGVRRAEEGVFQLKKTNRKVHIHGPLIHNQNYIAMLKTHGIESVNHHELIEGETLVIRTHGIPKDEENELAKKFILKDMTCPIVKRVQKSVEKASHDNAFLIISGKANHAEVKGLVSYAQYYTVLENSDELEFFLQNYQTIIPLDIAKIFIISQTTYSSSFFELIKKRVQEIIQNIPIEIKNTICPITENKEKEALQLQKEVDFTIVIGDPNSSNSKKLFAILKNANSKTLFTQNCTHLKSLHCNWIDIHTILVVSSTSTPLFIEEEIVNYLKKLS